MVIALLLPAGQLLKNQNPWNCFNFTEDESFFSQASQNWSEGKGYRMHQTLPFDPTITAGIPMAWGASAFQKLTGEDIAHSGRVFVYFCFIFLLFLIARSSYYWDRNWLAVPLGLWIFSYGLSKTPFGGYMTFGFLGETPALLAGALLYRALDRKHFLISGILAVAVFIIKPTFVFLLPAVGIAALLASGRATFWAGLGMVASLGGYFYFVSVERNQTLFSFIDLFFQESNRIANVMPPGSFLDFSKGIDPTPAVYSVLFLAFGAFGMVFNRKKVPASQTTAFILFVFSCIYFFGMGKLPVTKQWSAILALCLLGFAPYWSANIANRFSGWIPKEMLAATTIAVVLTWGFSVGQLAHHQFKRTPESACPSKEQSAINREFRALVDKGEAKQENTVVVREFIPYSGMIYRAGFNPTYVTKLDPKTKPPKWVIGETKLLFPEPKGCEKYWRAGTFSMLKCAQN